MPYEVLHRVPPLSCTVYLYAVLYVCCIAACKCFSSHARELGCSKQLGVRVRRFSFSFATRSQKQWFGRSLLVFVLNAPLLFMFTPGPPDLV